MDTIIRKATLADIQTIQKLNHDLFISDNPSDPELNLKWPFEKAGEDYFRRTINGEIGICFVAESNKDLVGYLAGCISTSVPSYRPIKRSEISNMLVREDYRNQGIGTKLIDAFIEWSKQNRVDKVFVVAYSPNIKAIEFYKKNGFNSYSVELEQGINPQ